MRQSARPANLLAVDPRDGVASEPPLVAVHEHQQVPLTETLGEAFVRRRAYL
jgi:hypothetical protein